LFESELIGVEPPFRLKVEVLTNEQPPTYTLTVSRRWETYYSYDKRDLLQMYPDKIGTRHTKS